MHRISRVTALLAVLSAIVFMGTTFYAQDASLSQLPLLSSSNLSYLGSFTLPSSDGSGTAQGSFGYSGQALSVTPEGTLLLGGHTWYSTLCEVSIPAIGGTATVKQRCVDVTEGRLPQVDGGEIKYGGSLVDGGRLIVSAYAYYDADANQKLTHFASGTTLATSGDVMGPVQVGTAGAGFVSGYMGLIPAEWHTSFGATALSGNCCIPIISRTSSGPALSVFNPGDVGNISPVPATQVLGYPLDRPLADAKSKNALFTRADQIGGVAFPTGTRSVLFIGRHGAGTPCYGEGAACGDQADSYKGEHAYPYVHQVWAYDANDLVAVKNGSKRPYDVKPYATWQLKEMNNAGNATIRSAFYEPATNRIYVTEAYGESPKVHVYQVNGGGTVTPPTEPPTNPPVDPPVDPPATEICGDGLDNDQDGLVDEGCTTQPEQPTQPELSLPGVPSSLSARVRRNRVTLSWTGPSSGGAVAGYVIEQGSAAGATSTTTKVGATQLSTRVSGLSRGRYYFRVRAINASGTSGTSNEASIAITSRR